MTDPQPPLFPSPPPCPTCKGTKVQRTYGGDVIECRNCAGTGGLGIPEPVPDQTGANEQLERLARHNPDTAEIPY